jgi:phosphoribosylglycinamide formyltransferase-1
LATHGQALTAGVKVHGATVHFVTTELDHGPIVDQTVVPVRPEDTEETLAARVLLQEHVMYPRAVRWFVEDRLTIENGLVQVASTTESVGMKEINQ